MAERANTTTTSRRLFLAAGPAAAVFGALNTRAGALADASLFALVDQGKHLWKQIGDYANLCDSVLARNENREILPEHEDAPQEAQDDYMAAFDEMVSTTPQSVAGVRAMLEWIEMDCGGLALDEEHVHAAIASLLASPVLVV